MTRVRSFVTCVLCLLPFALNAQSAPPPQAAIPEEAALLAQGWTKLAAGDAGAAAEIAAEALGLFPASPAALLLVVDADIARAGSLAALSSYEAWLGGKRLDAAYVLRRIARAALREAAAGTEARPRLAALRILAADKDTDAIATLTQASSQGQMTETVELARLGQERAVRALIGQLQAPIGHRATVIEALGDSRSRLAVAPLTKLLSDNDVTTRALAASALGRLGATEAVPALRPLLADEKQIFPVRFAAAGALHRLSDPSGTIFLQQIVADNPHSQVRINAAQQLAATGDTSWQPVVRSLAGDRDPTVRLGVSRLLAPYDQPLAQSLLEALLLDQNLVVRELASAALAGQVAADFATLRRLLRGAEAVMRVAAAGRILELTR